jgi:VWFA-related protein
MGKLPAIVLFILAIAQSSSAQPSSQVTAAEVLARVSSVYASCRSYADEGEVSTQVVIGSKPMVQDFTTAFLRPDKFRFEFLAHRGARFVVWKAGALEFAEWPAGVRPAEIDETLLNLFMTSHGAAVTVPALLFPEVFHGPGLFASLASIKLSGEEKIDGHRAFKIQAYLQNEPFTLWVDTNQFLILKVEQKSRLGGMDLRTITKYRPVVNAAISPDRLAFNPRNGSSRIVDELAPATGESNAASAPSLKRFGSSLTLSRQETEKLRKERHSEDEDVIRVDTDLVVCDVLVVDGQGRSIQNLGAPDFILKEDNQPQEIASFSLGNADTVPRSIVIIIDYSSSQLPYVITSVEAAKTLVDKLKPRDRMAVVTDDVKLLVDFTSDKQLLKSRLDALKKRAMSGWLGRSRQYDALMVTLNELFGSEDARPIIIFQTDGDQLDSLGATVRNPSLQPYEAAGKYVFEDLLMNAERVRVTVYSIIPGVRFNGLSGAELLDHAKLDWNNRQEADAILHRLHNLPKPYATLPSDDILIRSAQHWNDLHLGVTRVANVTGGWADYLERPEQADDLYARILNDINQRYVVGYYPKNRTRDGKRRSVSIEVRGHPEYAVIGRKTYFAPQP